MVKSVLKKILKKKSYKAEIHISDDDFVAEYYSDSLTLCLKWIIAGLSETYATSDNRKSLTRGIYGHISTLSLFHLQDGVLKIGEYKKPRSVDYLFMTDAMVYVPDSIMRKIKEEDIPSEIFK